MGFQILAWGSTRVSLRISLLSALCLCPFDEDDYKIICFILSTACNRCD